MTAKTPGQLAYEADVARRPLYSHGQPRRTWAELCHVARWSWERNPTPRWDAIAPDYARDPATA